jgi:predicted transcriptional regulator
MLNTGTGQEPSKESIQQAKIKIIQEKIRLLQAAYEDFHDKMEKLKKEGHDLVNQTLQEIDQQKVKEVLEKLKSV